ncbi:phospho-sugar mutase [Candidatus Saccharibacteria bacterium]|nr:phospho-sugar mutase [Candidatus Saccharibacteria bacterium]
MVDELQKNLSRTSAENVEEWLTKDKFAEYKQELEAMILQGRWEELEDAFYTKIVFGTAGIRGITGLGSARVSRITIAEATQGLCLHARDVDDDAKQKGIVIACDTRLTSDEFSKLAASVCAGNGMKAYLFDGYRSTPELSFAIRHLNAAAGIVISASHNLPSDNGFKAYMADGGQLVAPHDSAVVNHVNCIETVAIEDYDSAVAAGKIEIIGKAVDDAYVSAVLAESLSTEKDLHVVYSPLHGAGQRNTLPVLQEAGYKVTVVARQMTPDGRFPTVENNKPNPEERAANDLAVATMMAEDADIAITNDPDADRIGVMIRQDDEPKYLSGNQSAALATEYVLSKLADSKSLLPSHYIAKTIVTTDLLDAIAHRYGVRVYGDMLIGFKYIGELLLNKEQTAETFVIGCEESYGLLKGSYARDKDGAVGALVLSEYAAELKAQGKTLYDRLLEMYREYGIYTERLDNIVCPGAKGFEQMQSIMALLRSDSPKLVGSHEVSAVADYQSLERLSVDGDRTPLACTVTGDVIVLEFNDPRCRITIRPSGTEPKLKLYVQWHTAAIDSTPESVERQVDDINDMLEGLSRELEGLLLNA